MPGKKLLSNQGGFGGFASLRFMGGHPGADGALSSKGQGMPRKRRPSVKPVVVHGGDLPDGQRPEAVADAMVQDLAGVEAIGLGIYDYQLGQKEWPGDADIADEDERKKKLSNGKVSGARHRLRAVTLLNVHSATLRPALSVQVARPSHADDLLALGRPGIRAVRFIDVRAGLGWKLST